MSGTHKSLFLSYSRADADEAWIRALDEALQAHDLALWRHSASIAAGDSIPDAISDALRRCDAVLVLLSEQYLKSPWAAFELGAALSQGKRIIPIVPDNIEPARWPAPLRIRQMTPMRTPVETAEAIARALRTDSRMMEAG
ncbi:TIR domain protein [Phycisphaerae bacterium RAS1]|nr:TIR domain protein [Phycisphaerae bacterium RAS1]